MCIALLQNEQAIAADRVDSLVVGTILTPIDSGYQSGERRDA
jgi:hypothetical protein